MQIKLFFGRSVTGALLQLLFSVGIVMLLFFLETDDLSKIAYGVLGPWIVLISLFLFFVFEPWFRKLLPRSEWRLLPTVTGAFGAAYILTICTIWLGFMILEFRI